MGYGTVSFSRSGPSGWGPKKIPQNNATTPSVESRKTGSSSFRAPTTAESCMIGSGSLALGTVVKTAADDLDHRQNVCLERFEKGEVSAFTYATRQIANLRDINDINEDVARQIHRHKSLGNSVHQKHMFDGQKLIRSDQRFEMDPLSLVDKARCLLPNQKITYTLRVVDVADHGDAEFFGGVKPENKTPSQRLRGGAVENQKFSNQATSNLICSVDYRPVPKEFTATANSITNWADIFFVVGACFLGYSLGQIVEKISWILSSPKDSLSPFEAIQVMRDLKPDEILYLFKIKKITKQEALFFLKNKKVFPENSEFEKLFD